MENMKFEVKKLEEYPNISVVIPTYNDAKTLDKIIPSILNQKYDGDIDITVVNDNSTDNSLDIIKKYKVKVISHKKNMGLANTVNDGVKNAKYDFVCVLHADCFLADDEWFKKLIPYLVLNSDVACVTSAFILPREIYNQFGFWEKAMHAWEVEKKVGEEIGVLDYSDGSNDIWKKEIFLRFGGYDAETYRVACEDVDLCKRMEKEGYKVLSTPVIAYHLHSSHATGISTILFKKNAQISEGQGVIFRKYKFRASSINNQLFKTTALVFLFVPITIIRIIGLIYIVSIIFGYTYIAFKKMRNLKVLVLLPPIKLLDFMIDVVCFWKGFLTKKQRL